MKSNPCSFDHQSQNDASSLFFKPIVGTNQQFDTCKKLVGKVLGGARGEHGKQLEAGEGDHREKLACM